MTPKKTPYRDTPTQRISYDSTPAKTIHMTPSPQWLPWLICMLAPGLNAATIRHIDKTHGLDVFLDNILEIAPPLYLSPQSIHALRYPPQATIDTQQRWAHSKHHHILCISDPHYPWALRYLPDPPLLLWVKGQIDCLQRPQLAIVGSRKATPAARDLCFLWAQELAQAGWVITSGLALGIDGCAHRGALASCGQTIAVLGSACDRIYPQAHHKLAHSIAEQGALLSEWPLGTGPRKHHFPQRNRIISGLSMGTVVIEAGIHSGSLITARLAAEQGREVFAVPGATQNPLSQGCHDLIKKGAKLAAKTTDIIEEFTLTVPTENATKKNNHPTSSSTKLASEAQWLLECVDFTPTTVQQLMVRTEKSLSWVLTWISELELNNQVYRHLGAYVRVSQQSS